MKRFEHCIAVMERALSVHAQTMREAKIRNDLAAQAEVAEELARDLREGIAKLGEEEEKRISNIECSMSNVQVGEEKIK